uniref:Putative ovule protein n=1 Tax=Solanum chacoense TaxID=4108 RepID=A0A0V0H9B3_SOLCH
MCLPRWPFFAYGTLKHGCMVLSAQAGGINRGVCKLAQTPPSLKIGCMCLCSSESRFPISLRTNIKS